MSNNKTYKCWFKKKEKEERNIIKTVGSFVQKDIIYLEPL